MKKQLLTLLLLSIFLNSKAQTTFQKAIGGTGAVTVFGKSGEQTTDGGYIIAGFSNYSADYDVYLIKTDADGDTLWTKTFGNGGDEFGNSVQQTSDGGYIITGSTLNFTSGHDDVYLIKTNSNGNVLWAKTYGGSDHDIGTFVRQTLDGGYIITGRTQSFNPGDMDVYLIRTDGNGDTLWTKTFGGVFYMEAGYSVEQTTDGGFVITGSAGSFGSGGNDVYLIKTDANGNLIWSKTYGGTNYDDGFSVQQTTDGGYVIAGRTNSFGSGAYDVYLIKTDGNGDMLWSKTYGEADVEDGYSVQQTTDGGYIITGWTSSFGGNSEAYLIRTDANGVLLWSKMFGSTAVEVGYLVKQTSDGGYVITGYTETFVTGLYGVYLIKTDSLGNSGCNEISTPTIETTPSTLLTIPPTIITSPPTIVTTATTLTGSEGIVTTLCTTVSINEITKGNSFLVSPNPSSGNFSISFERTIMKGTVEISNILGENVYAENIVNQSRKEINLKNAAAGIYFIKVFVYPYSTGNGQKYYCRKVIVEHD